MERHGGTGGVYQGTSARGLFVVHFRWQVGSTNNGVQIDTDTDILYERYENLLFFPSQEGLFLKLTN